MNFAIRGEVLRGFLEKNRVDFTASRDTAKLENSGIVSQGAAVTVRVRVRVRLLLRPPLYISTSTF